MWNTVNNWNHNFTGDMICSSTFSPFALGPARDLLQSSPNWHFSFFFFQFTVGSLNLCQICQTCTVWPGSPCSTRAEKTLIFFTLLLPLPAKVSMHESASQSPPSHSTSLSSWTTISLLLPPVFLPLPAPTPLCPLIFTLSLLFSPNGYCFS